MKTATFCGHGDFDCSHLKDKLYETVENLIKQGATIFLLGGYGKFDGMCAVVVKELKSKYPHIDSILVIPYFDRKYNTNLYDRTEFPPIENTPRRFAISKRNECMVDKSDYVIAYVTHSWGGAAKTLEYAMKKRKNYIQLILMCH